LRRNVIQHLYAPEALKDETRRIALEIAQNAPLAVTIAKQGVLNHMKSLSQSLLFESKGQAVCFRTADLSEGVSAIRAKRTPAFTGK